MDNDRRNQIIQKEQDLTNNRPDVTAACSGTSDATSFKDWTYLTLSTIGKMKLSPWKMMAKN